MLSWNRTESLLDELTTQVGAVDLSTAFQLEHAIGEDEIHVWSANLDCGRDALLRFEETLSGDERSRACRFSFARDNNRYIVARGILRNLLGAYSQVPPERLEFTYSEYGKPSLWTSDSRSAHLQFNLSHSHGFAVYAIAYNHNVGIDVELVRHGFDTDRIAERYFSIQELEQLRALPSTEQCEGFFQYWTRKEAYAKARGTGFQIVCDSFGIRLAPLAPTRFLKDLEGEWSLVILPSANHCRAALVYDGMPCRVRCF